MAIQDGTIPGSGTGNIYIDSLLLGSGWNISDGQPINIFFASGPIPGVAAVGEPWTADELAAFNSILANFESVCGLRFNVVTTYDQADMVEWRAPSTVLQGGTGRSDFPEGLPRVNSYYNFENFTWGTITPGGFTYGLFIHELGHALGLAHPHDGGDELDATRFPGVELFLNSFAETGDFSLNQQIFTVMSYNQGWSDAPFDFDFAFGGAGTLMALDIA